MFESVTESIDFLSVLVCNVCNFFMIFCVGEGFDRVDCGLKTGFDDL